MRFFSKEGLTKAIGRAEGADPFVIVPAAILHDIGLAGTEVDSAATRGHGPRGAKEASKVLEDMGFPNSVASEVVNIIASHHNREAMKDVNARTIWDADLIVNLKRLPREDALEKLRQKAWTESGRRLGEKHLNG